MTREEYNPAFIIFLTIGMVMGIPTWGAFFGLPGLFVQGLGLIILILNLAFFISLKEK